MPCGKGAVRILAGTRVGNAVIGQNNLVRGFGFRPGSSAAHRLNPICKIGILVLFTALGFSSSNPWQQATLFLCLVYIGVLSKTGFTSCSSRLRMLFFFALTILLVQMLFYQQGVPLITLALGRFTLTVWSLGLFRGIGMALRFINIVGASYLFVLTTDPSHLAYSLMQAGLPYRYGFTLVAALRFIPVFGYEMTQVRNAHLCKGIDPSTLSIRGLTRYVRYTVMPLLVSALEKVDNLTISMEGRGFGLYPQRTYRVSYALTVRDIVETAIVVATVTGLWFVAGTLHIR